jgi:2-hydroxychromene-2-carboxylate isomerase
MPSVGQSLSTNFETNARSDLRNGCLRTEGHARASLPVRRGYQALMGELIVLTERMADRSRPLRDRRPAFFFDLSCPFSYLASERIERALGEVEWVPTAAVAFRGIARGEAPEAVRADAERRAAALRLPLVWPDRFPAAAAGAVRAAVYASEIGAGARFVLAATRLAFSGGFDLEDPEILAAAAAAAGVPLDACLAAAADPARDRPVHATASALRARGVRRLPAIRIGRQLYDAQGVLAGAA